MKWTYSEKKKKKAMHEGQVCITSDIIFGPFLFLSPPPPLSQVWNFWLNYTLKILLVHISGSSNSKCLKADPSFLPMACTHSSSCIPHLGCNSYIFHGTQTKISAFPSPYQLVTKSCIICLLGISSNYPCFPSSLAIKTLTFSCLGNTI